ncbi:TPA: pyridoxine/pyridoxal/pyridoxamine kinase [Stenotrophomonas maltophilia]|nr:pyridoxine/pyridoxal/pyridoxamine kinase [Stenotrophomonas maltophilia]
MNRMANATRPAAASLSEHRRALAIDVVSVQSQVVYGRVGNNAAVPTLQALGLSVAAVPTVVYSNIPSYPTMHGGALPVEWFSGYLRDLSARGALDALRAIQVGYLGGPAQAHALADWLSTVTCQHPKVKVIVDPVIGDEDHGVYGIDGTAEVYRTRIMTLANGLTPNGFELGQLVGYPVHDMDAVVSAARSLLVGRTEWIAVTSAAPATWEPGEMKVALVTRDCAHVVSHPRIGIALAGTGDLFSAAVTGHWLTAASLPDAVANACKRVLASLHRTEDAHSKELLLPDPSMDFSDESIILSEIPGRRAASPYMNPIQWN